MKKLTKKKPKPATPAQKAARERNWNKGQVSCIRSIAYNLYNSKTTKDIERIDLGIIIDATSNILQHWK